MSAPVLKLLAQAGPLLLIANEIRGAITVALLLSSGRAHEMAAVVMHAAAGMLG